MLQHVELHMQQLVLDVKRQAVKSLLAGAAGGDGSRFALCRLHSTVLLHMSCTSHDTCGVPACRLCNKWTPPRNL